MIASEISIFNKGSKQTLLPGIAARLNWKTVYSLCCEI